MISLDTLRFLRKKKFWIALVGVFVIIVMTFVDLQNSTYNKYQDAFQMQNVYSVIPEFVEHDDYVEEVQTVVDRIQPALNKEDWRTVNQTISDLYSIRAYNQLMFLKDDDMDLYYHDYLRGKEDIIKLVETRELPVVTEDDVDDLYYETGILTPQNAQEFPYYRMQAQYYQRLADQNVDSLNASTMDSSTIFVQFLRVLFPLLPILMAAIMCYDTIQEDKDSGVIKVLLTQPFKRSKYMKKKIMINMKMVSCIFMFPLLMISLCYGIFDHYNSIKAPVLANAQGVISLEMQAIPEENVMTGWRGQGQIGITSFYPVPTNSMSPNPELDFIEMWQFVGLSLLLGVFIVTFCVLATTLFALLFKNKIVALAVSLILMFAGSFFTNSMNSGVLYACLPFTYMNPVNIVMGFSSYTYLNGIVVLTISNLLLYILLQEIFKKAKIVC